MSTPARPTWLAEKSRDSERRGLSPLNQPPIRQRADGHFEAPDKLFELLVDLADEDSFPVVHAFYFVDEHLPPKERVQIVRDWLSAAGARGWIETTDPSYPVTVIARFEDVDPWLLQHGEDFAAGRLAYADVRCPEIFGSDALRSVLDAEKFHRLD
jgi:hypothetical protein